MKEQRHAGSWDGVAEWWRSEVSGDPVYREDIAPMLDRLLGTLEIPVIELACGEGQWLRHIGLTDGVFGMDASHSLLKEAKKSAPVVQGVLPELDWLRHDSIGSAFSLFVLDLIEDHERFLEEAARVVRSGGSLVVIVNHPAFTAPGSGPFMDDDFDVFWRWGTYLQRGESPVPAGNETMIMHHRPTAELLTAAARHGWALEEMIEAPLGPAAIEREPSYLGQESIPRFLGVRWRKQ